MEQEKYQGWTNYATWRINLELWDDDSWIKDFEPVAGIYELSEYLKDTTDEILTGYGEYNEGAALDYARAFVSEVNFYEIAEHIAEDYPQIIKK